MHRSEYAGVRCIRVSDDRELVGLRVSFDLEGQVDEIDLTPVSLDVFAALRRQYEYDPTPLNPKTKLEPQSRSDWRLEVVTIDTAYGEQMERATISAQRQPAAVPGCCVFPKLRRRHEDRGRQCRREQLALLHSPQWTGTGCADLRRHVRPTAHPYPGFNLRAKVQLVIRWAQDLMRTMDYLETREDIDVDKVAYYGFSLGGTYAPVFTAVEQRFAASVLISGGTIFRLPEEHRPVNFAPHVTVPTLMIGGKNDPQAPVETYQRPILELLGAPP